MSLKEEDRKTLVILEIERADSNFSEYVGLVEKKYWNTLANRLYYALFHAVSALLISDQHEVGTHRGAVNQFSLYYIKTGIFSKDEGRLYSNLQKLREDGDYNCYIDVDQKDVEPFIEPTRQLIEKIKKYIAEKN